MATAYTGPKLPGLTNGGKLAHGYRPLNLTLLVFFRVLLPNKRAEKTSGRPKPQAISPSSVLETSRRCFLFRLQLFFICRGATQRHYLLGIGDFALLGIGDFALLGIGDFA
jgi:hypothetical protein